MEVSGILVINDQSSASDTAGELISSEQRELSRGSIACADIFGQSVLDRMIERLRDAGIRHITVIGGANVPDFSRNRKLSFILCANPFARWHLAQRIVSQMTHGIDTTLMIGLNAYLEVNIPDALLFYRAQGTPLTQLADDHGPLDFWVVDSQWFSTSASDCTMPFRYGEFPGLPIPHRIHGYVNRLAKARDLRRLVLDSFLGRCAIRPRGKEVRPGIWIDDGARVDKFARLVAPVYLGSSSKVETSAVITRFTNVEHSCQVNEGTVVDGATVLPHTVLGSGLDVSHAVVDGNKLVDLDRDISVRIDDPSLIRDTAPRTRRTERDQRFAGDRGLEFDYSRYLARAADRLAVLFRG